MPVRSDLTGAFRVAWDRLAAPGTWWTGTERVALAEVARAAYAGADLPTETGLSDPAVTAATLLGREPAAITEQLIIEWEASGLDPSRYVELISVVAQVTAIDTFHRAMGIDLEPLLGPLPGEPTRQLPDTPVRKTRAWVPMVGLPSIPQSLSAVPAETAALEALHGPMYLSYAEMGDPAIEKGLSRAQMELIAARTSAINECFF